MHWGQAAMQTLGLKSSRGRKTEPLRTKNCKHKLPLQPNMKTGDCDGCGQVPNAPKRHHYEFVKNMKSENTITKNVCANKFLNMLCSGFQLRAGCKMPRLSL